MNGAKIQIARWRLPVGAEVGSIITNLTNLPSGETTARSSDVVTLETATPAETIGKRHLVIRILAPLPDAIPGLVI